MENSVSVVIAVAPKTIFPQAYTEPLILVATERHRKPSFTG